ncbi:hypothetical protein EGO56_21600 (plasmid) [Pantoea vagans]|nr:hypothetical protein EGO56_21600 [Pantoea vagans]
MMAESALSRNKVHEHKNGVHVFRSSYERYAGRSAQISAIPGEKTERRSRAADFIQNVLCTQKKPVSDGFFQA